jgi:hypothetical protein
MDFRVKPDPAGSGETVVEVCEGDVVLAIIRAGDFPLSLWIISKCFSHAVFDCHQQPERLIAHFKEGTDGPTR